MIPFSYDIMQPMYPLLIQQFLDDYNLSEIGRASCRERV